MTEDCADCRFFVYDSCRRYPPAHQFVVENETGKNVIHGIWPPVLPGYWCGEFVPKKGTKQ